MEQLLLRGAAGKPSPQLHISPKGEVSIHKYVNIDHRVKLPEGIKESFEGKTNGKLSQGGREGANFSTSVNF